MIKHISLIVLISLFGQTVFAQKEYVDPSVKVKRPLLESADEVKPSSVGLGSPSVSGVNPKEIQYCACVNSQRLTEQASQMHLQMARDKHISHDELYRLDLSGRANEEKKLIQKFVNNEELEPSDIDCNVVRVNTKKFKVLMNEISKLDEVCKFEEIKRKQY